jgi:hypothetical protein
VVSSPGDGELDAVGEVRREQLFPAVAGHAFPVFGGDDVLEGAAEKIFVFPSGEFAEGRVGEDDVAFAENEHAVTDMPDDALVVDALPADFQQVGVFEAGSAHVSCSWFARGFVSTTRA